MENTNKFKVYIEEKTQDYGKIFLEPLERGYGDTLGNALRRLLLSSIGGAAVTAVRIEGVLHEFSTIKGIREDVIEILMNLKQIPIKAKHDNIEQDPEAFKIITLDSDNLPKDFFTRAENPGVITAKDMPWDNDFEFYGDKILCTLETDAHLVMEIYVEQGVGYLSSERERPSKPQLPVDALLTDAVFSPVKRVNYQIEPARVGQSIDYERLVLEVWTNGTITPQEAVKQAADIAKDYFTDISANVLAAPMVATRSVEKTTTEVVAAPVVPDDTIDEDYETRPIQEYLGLNIRCVNCLRRSGINVVGDLVERSYEQLLKIRNLGKKSLNEIVEKLEDRGLSLKPSDPNARIDYDDDDADVDVFEDDDDLTSQGFSSDKSGSALMKDIFTDTEGAIEEVINNEAADDSGEKEEEKETVKKPKPRNGKAKTDTKAEPKTKSRTKKVKDDEVKAEAEAEEAALKEPSEEVKAEKEKTTKSAKTTKTKTKTKAVSSSSSSSKKKTVKAEKAEEVKEEAKETEVKEAESEQTKEAKTEKKSKSTADKAKTTKSKAKAKTKTEAESESESKSEEAEKPKKAEKKSEKNSSKKSSSGSSSKSKAKSKSKSETETESKSEDE